MHPWAKINCSLPISVITYAVETRITARHSPFDKRWLPVSARHSLLSSSPATALWWCNVPGYTSNIYSWQSYDVITWTDRRSAVSFVCQEESVVTRYGSRNWKCAAKRNCGTIKITGWKNLQSFVTSFPNVTDTTWDKMYRGEKQWRF